MSNDRSLSEYVETRKVIFFLVPIVTNKINFVNELIKYTPALNYNTKLVTTDKSSEGERIAFNELKEKYETLQDTCFIIFDYNLLLHYAGDLLNKINSNNFIILLNAEELDKSLDYNKLLNISNVSILFPKNMDLPINFITSTRKTYIFGNQLKSYFDKILEISEKDNKNYQDSSKYLNAYFDENIKSLEGINLDKALQRAPKFKTILLDILIKNKKRHLIKMIDGEYGIDSFLSVYNKIKDIPRLVIIKNSDSYSEKVKRMRIFNESNAPGILLTDYSFSGDMVPDNINVYHLTDGGCKDDIISIMSMCKAKHYNGSYPRDFNILNHIAVSTGADITVDEDRYNNFMKDYQYVINNYDFTRKNSVRVYLKGNELYTSLKN